MALRRRGIVSPDQARFSHDTARPLSEHVAERPMLRIPAVLEKGNRDRLLPIAPEFAEFLLTTPEDQRTGTSSIHLP